MKYSYLLFILRNYSVVSTKNLRAMSMRTSSKIIKNVDIPSCKNCIYYKPYNNDKNFSSTLSICEKFGEKNIITDIITFDCVKIARNDETKCGHRGKYFEIEPQLLLKKINHKIRYHSVMLGTFIFIGFVLYVNILG